METGERSISSATAADGNPFEGLSVDELDRRLREAAAHIHSATAELTALVTAFERTGAWDDSTLRSFPHWLAVCTGFSLRSGRDLVRVGKALEEMPSIRAAFLSGELSFDKVRLVTEVATAGDEQQWAGLARALSASQLARICRRYRQALAAEEPGRSEAQTAARGVWAQYKDDGMLHLLAKLPPEEGALVVATLESLAGSRPLPDDSGAPVRDPARVAGDRWAARQADALVTVFEHAQQAVQVGGGGDGEPVELQPPLTRAQVVVHVDEAVLAGERREGRCEIENGPPIDAASLRRLACDGELVTIVERDGSPLDVGRARRRVPSRMRRALEARDRHCRFPGCGVPAGRSESHHLDGWALGGGTDLGRILVLCKFHHLRHHQGAFEIVEEAGGRVDFVAGDGRLIVASEPHPIDPGGGGAAGLRSRHGAGGIEIDRWTPLARAAGERFDLDHTLYALFESGHHQNAPPTDTGPAAPVEDISGGREESVESCHAVEVPSTSTPEPPLGRPPLAAVGSSGDPPEPEPVEPYRPSHDDRDEDVLRVLAERGSAGPNELVARLGLGVSEVLVRLTRLELSGLVRLAPGGYVSAGR